MCEGYHQLVQNSIVYSDWLVLVDADVTARIGRDSNKKDSSLDGDERKIVGY